jgi:hypothetical protein
LSLEIDYSFDAVETWQDSLAEQNIYDSWYDSGSGGLSERSVMTNTWESGKLINKLQVWQSGYDPALDQFSDTRTNFTTHNYDELGNDFLVVTRAGENGTGLTEWDVGRVEDRFYNAAGQVEFRPNIRYVYGSIFSLQSRAETRGSINSTNREVDR